MLHLLKAIWRGWKRLTHGLNAGIAWVLMAFVYWSTVFPVALAFRAFRPDPIDRGLGDPEGATYWLAMRQPQQDILRSQRPW